MAVLEVDQIYANLCKFMQPIRRSGCGLIGLKTYFKSSTWRSDLNFYLKYNLIIKFAILFEIRVKEHGQKCFGCSGNRL